MSDKSRLSVQLRQRIQAALAQPNDGQVPVLLAPAQSDLAPVLHDEIAIQRFVESDCGAEGFTVRNGRLVALRWRDGVAFPVKEYDIEAYGYADR